jgi:hypothetical protein
MFGTQHEYYLWLRGWSQTSSMSGFLKRINPHHRHVALTAVAGALAGLTEGTLTPLERVQSVLQMQKYHASYKHTWHVFQQVTKNHGFKELYRGFTAICLRNSLSNALFFTSRAPIKGMFPQTKNNFAITFYDFLNGGILGAVISTLFYPLNVVKSHMQARVGGNFLSMHKAFILVYESRGKKFSHMYKGVASNFTRAIFAWGITNSAYEFCLKLLKEESDETNES